MKSTFYIQLAAFIVGFGLTVFFNHYRLHGFKVKLRFFIQDKKYGT